METSPIRQLLQNSLQNDQRIDQTEFAAIRKAIESDDQVQADEVQLLTDALTHNQFEAQAIAPVIDFISKNLSKPQESVPAAQPQAKPEEKPAAQPEAKSPWTRTHTLQGSFNHTSVSDGWNGQYGSEKTATKIEGSFQTDVNYQQGRVAWKNRLLVEYGNTFVKGEKERAVSRDNLEFTSEAGYTLEKKGNVKIEIPYATLYTKGPLTAIDGRKVRETSGAKITYTPNQQGEYSLKVGAGFQQTQDPAAASWNNEFGVEAVVEAKQSLGFMKAPIIKATGVQADTVGFLERFEANVQVNAFNPLQSGFAVSNTDIGMKVGARYYLTDKKTVWLGATQQYEYGGKADSTWERKFSADAGFKFE